MNEQEICNAVDVGLRAQMALLEKEVPSDNDVKMFGKVINDPKTGYLKYMWKSHHILTVSPRGDIKREVLTT